MEVDPSQQPLLEQAQARDFHRTRPKPVTSDLCRGKPEPGTSTRAGKREQPLREQT